MQKKVFIDTLAEKLSLPKKQVRAMLDTFLETLTETLAKGDSMSFLGFGRFSVKKRSAREGRNPQTGKPLHIAAKKVVNFKAGKALKKSVNS